MVYGGRRGCGLPKRESLEVVGAAGAVPEMKDLDDVRGCIDPIVDQDGSVDELADTGPTAHEATNVREAP